MPRKPNTKCQVCGKPTYKRPNQIKTQTLITCGRECYDNHRRLDQKPCKQCKKMFAPSHDRVMFCSRQCAQEGRGRTRNKYKYPGKSPNERRLNELKANFEFDCCMVMGCKYNTTYDIHRFIQGKDGGEYVVGNMFAICPNHHAEVHRKLIVLKKIDDCTLEARKIGE